MRHVTAAALVVGMLAAGMLAAAGAPAQDTARARPDLGAVVHDSARRAQGGAAGADARALLRLEDQWAAALVRRDSSFFRRTLAAGFVYTENDRMIGRDELIRDLVSGSDTIRAAHNEDMRVHAFGAASVVTGWLVIGGRGAGGPFDNRYRFTDTWVKRNGRWQIVAAQDYLVPTGAR